MPVDSAPWNICSARESLEKLRGIATSLEEKKIGLSSAHGSKKPDHQLISAKRISRQFPNAREQLRWELQRVCSGKTCVKPSWVCQETSKWRMDRTGVDASCIKASLSSWKFDWIKNSAARKAVETMAQGKPKKLNHRKIPVASRFELEQVQSCSSDSSMKKGDELKTKDCCSQLDCDSSHSSMHNKCEQSGRVATSRATIRETQASSPSRGSCRLVMPSVCNKEPEQCTHQSPSTSMDIWTFIMEAKPSRGGILSATCHGDITHRKKESRRNPLSSTKEQFRPSGLLPQCAPHRSVLI